MDKIKRNLKYLLSFKTANPRECNIDGLIPYDIQIESTFPSKTSESPVSETVLVKVLATVLMDKAEKVLLKGQLIPEEYIEKAKSSLPSVESWKDEEFDFDLNNADEDDNDNNHSVPSNNGEQNNDSVDTEDIEYSYGHYKHYLESFLKEMDKYMRVNPKNYTKVLMMHEEMLGAQMQQANDGTKNQSSPSHRMVSSNGPIERSPNGKRYKSFHEKYKC